MCIRDRLQPIGMLVVLDSILNRITQNRAKGRRTFIFTDEIYLLFQHEYSGNFLLTFRKRVRKYGAYCTGITQNVDCLLYTSMLPISNPSALPIWSAPVTAWTPEVSVLTGFRGRFRKWTRRYSKAVSYTHLDVYKRQVLPRFGQYNKGR